MLLVSIAMYDVCRRFSPYLDLKVAVQERLELKRLVALVGDDQRGVQALAAQRHAVQKTKLVGPRLAGGVGESF